MVNIESFKENKNRFFQLIIESFIKNKVSPLKRVFSKT